MKTSAVAAASSLLSDKKGGGGSAENLWFRKEALSVVVVCMCVHSALSQQEPPATFSGKIYFAQNTTPARELSCIDKTPSEESEGTR
jgi:hypothetical protein